MPEGDGFDRGGTSKMSLLCSGIILETDVGWLKPSDRRPIPPNREFPISTSWGRLKPMWLEVSDDGPKGMAPVLGSADACVTPWKSAASST